MTDVRAEARHILLNAAPGIVDERIHWAVGAHLAWHAAHLASAWDRGLIVDTDSAGGTLNDGHRWRSYTADRRHAVLVDRRGHHVLTVRLADVIPLVDQARLPTALVTQVREVLTERDANTKAGLAASQRHLTGRPDPAAAWDAWQDASTVIERRCRDLAAQAWAHVRPADTLFDLAGAA